MVGKMRWIDDFSGLDGMNAGLTQQWLLTADSRLFHTLATATRNSRSPSDDLLFLVVWVQRALANSMSSDAVWAPLERLVEVGRTGRVVPDYFDTSERYGLSARFTTKIIAYTVVMSHSRVATFISCSAFQVWLCVIFLHVKFITSP